MANTVKIGITASDEGFKSNIDGMSKSAQGLGSTISAAGREFKTVKGAVGALTKEAQMLTVQWRELDESMRNSDAGQQLYQQMQNTIARAAELKDVAGDVANEIKNMSSDTAMWDGMSQGIGVLSSGVQGLAAVYGLLGGDVKAFTQALTVMNGIQSVTNTIIGIGNALQKDSALMVMLRTVRTKLFCTAEAAATSAIVAETAATEAQTTAQAANNAMLLANPYVAVAAAIVGLTATIIYWVEESDNATESQKALQAAAEAMTDTISTETSKAGEQINAFLQLKNTYDSCGGSVDQIKKKIIQNTEAQKKAGIQVKNLDQATRVFSSEGTKAFIRGCNARAMATAAEAAISATYAKVLAELNDLLNKIGTGAEVNVSDIEDLAKQLGISAKEMKNLASAAGYYEEHMTFTKNNMRLLSGNDALESQQQFIESLFEASRDHGALANLSKMAENWTKQADLNLGSGLLKGIVTDMDKNAKDISKSAGKTSKAANNTSRANRATSASAKKTAAEQKKTTEEVVKTLNTLDGCNAIIQEAQKKIQKLDKTSKTYAADKTKLENVIIGAKAAKLDLLGDDTLTELLEARRTIKDLKDSIPENAPILDALNKKLVEVNKKMQSLYERRAKSTVPDDLEDLQRFLNEILSTMKSTDPDYNNTVLNLKRVNSELEKLKQNQEDVYNGVQQGSKTWWKRIYEEQMHNVNDLQTNVPMNSEVHDLRRYSYKQLDTYGINMDYLKQALSDMWTDHSAIENALKDIQDSQSQDIEGIWQEVIDTYQKWLEKKLVSVTKDQRMYNAPKIQVDATFDYKKTDNEILDARIEELQKAHDDLKDLLDNNLISDSGLEYATLQLEEYANELTKLKRQQVFNEMAQDIKEYETSVRDGLINTIKDVKSGMSSLYSAFTELPDKLDNSKDALEGFFAVFDSMFSIVDAVISIINSINALSETFGLLDSARAAQSAMTERNVAALTSNVIILDELVGAQMAKATSDSSSVGPATAAAAALKAQAVATEQLAASQFFAAHASIPFAGAGIASGMVAEMETVLRGVGALAMFANGGIIQGSTTIGDRILVRANAGEMIINKRQQSNLFRALDHGIDGGSSAAGPTTVRIKGEDLYLSMHNHYKRTKKSPFK